MSRFQSQLFIWIERSLPVQLGRKARQILHKITVELAEKLSQTIEKIEKQPASTPVHSSIKKLLQPAKALVKFIAKHGSMQSATAPDQLHLVEQPLNPAISHAFGQAHSKNREQTSRDFRELNELIIKAIAYFQQKKRTLPAPTLPSSKSDRMELYAEMEPEQTVPWLDRIPAPSIGDNTRIVMIEKELDSWEEDLDDYCMRAWLETQTEFLGHADSPIIKFLIWLDRIILKIEKWLAPIWQKLINWWHSKFTRI
jgi:hypothetical protein